MKIALLHDYMNKYGGGERLVLNLAKALKADVYTGFIEPEKTFSTKGIMISTMGVKPWLPVVIRNRRIAKKFEQYDFSDDYDAFVMSGVWCISASKNHPCILYCHTPARFLYDLRDYFLQKTNFMQRFFLRRFIDYWMVKDQFYMHQFDKICPNSQNVKNRILRYYGKGLYKKCEVVHTGIDTKRFYYKESGDFYLSTSRLDPLKRVDLVISAFRGMPDKKLFITGSGPDERRLKTMARDCKNISFLGSVDEKTLIDLYARCKATIVSAKDEDLGLSAIESQAAGKPVIAVREGGLLETVNAKTGIFFEPNTKSLRHAVVKFEKIKWNRKLIQRNAKRFDIKVFLGKMKNIIKMVIKYYNT